jgi:MscS family membrane protein
MPPVLQAMGPYGLAWWQWLVLPLFAAAALGGGRVLGTISHWVLHRVLRRTLTTWDERWLARGAPALTVLWATALFRIALPSLELHDAAHAFAASVTTAASVVAVFWAVWRSVDVAVEVLVERTSSAHAWARAMLSSGGNLLKVFVVALGSVSTAAAFGYPVGTVLAGLGIGGIAVAFGAQKTVENVFGSIALAADQPLRVGDTVKVDGIEGMVEMVGARSTRFRTADRTLVTIPNGRLADSRIESLAWRDRLRMTTTVMLGYGATESQVRAVVEGVESLLRRHPLVWPDVVVARLANLSVASIDIEVLCWFQTADFETFRDARQEVLLGIIGVVERSGVRFAPPPAPPLTPPAAP